MPEHAARLSVSAHRAARTSSYRARSILRPSPASISCRLGDSARFMLSVLLAPRLRRAARCRCAVCPSCSSIWRRACATAAPAEPAPAPRWRDLAQQYVGSRYAWGGTSPAGFDCTGFVMFVYGQFGYRCRTTRPANWPAAPRVGDRRPRSPATSWSSPTRTARAEPRRHLPGRWPVRARRRRSATASSSASLWDGYWAPALRRRQPRHPSSTARLELTICRLSAPTRVRTCDSSSGECATTISGARQLDRARRRGRAAPAGARRHRLGSARPARAAARARAGRRCRRRRAARRRAAPPAASCRVRLAIGPLAVASCAVRPLPVRWCRAARCRCPCRWRVRRWRDVGAGARCARRRSGGGTASLRRRRPLFGAIDHQLRPVAARVSTLPSSTRIASSRHSSAERS